MLLAKHSALRLEEWSTRSSGGDVCDPGEVVREEAARSLAVARRVQLESESLSR